MMAGFIQARDSKAPYQQLGVNIFSRATANINSDDNEAITSVIKRGMKLLVHIKTSTVQPLQLGVDK